MGTWRRKSAPVDARRVPAKRFRASYAAHITELLTWMNAESPRPRASCKGVHTGIEVQTPLGLRVASPGDWIVEVGPGSFMVYTHREFLDQYEDGRI